MQTFDTSIDKMENQLKNWGTRLDELAAKTEKEIASAQEESRRKIAVLRAQHGAAQAKLGEVKQGGSAKWESFKAGIDVAWTDLELAIKKLAD